MPPESSDDGAEDLSEMDWLSSEVGFVLGEIATMEEEGVEDPAIEDVLASIVCALQEWLKFAKRGQYREPEDVRAAADELSDEARRVLGLMPRKRGKLQIPMIAALQHLQDFRDRIQSCVATPEEFREKEGA